MKLQLILCWNMRTRGITEQEGYNKGDKSTHNDMLC